MSSPTRFSVFAGIPYCVYSRAAYSNPNLNKFDHFSELEFNIFYMQNLNSRYLGELELTLNSNRNRSSSQP